LQSTDIVASAPVVGVLVGRKTIQDLQNQRARAEIRHLARANGEAKVVLFFFDTSSVDLVRKSILGMGLVRNTWQEKRFSIPDVLYIRGGGESKIIDKLVDLVREKGYIVNYPRFDKWNVYHCLKQHDQVKDYLPDTMIYTAPKDLETMLIKYGTVYLKPLRGRKGRKVIRVEQKDSGYRLSYFLENRGPHGGTEKKDMPKFSAIIKELNDVFGNTRFLVQQAIDLVTIDDKLVDLRAEMRRSKDGELGILGISARVGGSQSPITTHASAVTLDKYLTDICKYSTKTIPGIEEDIREFLFAVYEGIEDCYGKYGELGIDFGIDKQGRIWYIECNSQSTKVSLEKAYGKDIVYQSFLGVLNYAKHFYAKHQEPVSPAPEPPAQKPSPITSTAPTPPPVPDTIPTSPLSKGKASARKSILYKVKDYCQGVFTEKPERQVFVGVFVRQSVIKKLEKQENVFRLQRLAKANETAKTILYIFSIEDVNFEGLSITGTYYNSQKKQWEKGVFPFPDVLYNRKGNGGINTKKVRQLVKDLKIRMLNPVNDFDKWELYQKLSAINGVQDYLPATIKYNSVKDLRQMLTRYRCIYLKATVGRNATTVMRLRHVDDGYEASFVDDSIRTLKTSRWNEIVGLVQAFYGNREFLIQEGIPVYSISGQNVDMRAELQRNGKGKLEVTYISVRVGLKDSPVTSTRTESSVIGLNDFLLNKMRLSDGEYNRVLADMKNFLVTIYESVESIYGQFGELGIDFALDSTLKLWLIECNAKSAKMALILSSDEETIRQVFLNPLEYAKYIAK